MKIVAMAALAVVLAATGAAAQSMPGNAGSAQALRMRYLELMASFEDNAFGRPLHLASHEGAHRLQGEVYGILEHAFAQAKPALDDGANWCRILILPYSVKQCVSAGGDELTLYLGGRRQEADKAYRVDFRFHEAMAEPDYMRRMLVAERGPLGTRNYMITIEAAPLDASRSFIHLSYSYEFGVLARGALNFYLGTSGASKVGFSTEPDEYGMRRLVGGVRGAVERNTMRYFLAIEAFLDSLSAPAAEQLDARLKRWYDLCDHYPRQLWEMDRDEYLAIKRREAASP